MLPRYQVAFWCIAILRRHGQRVPGRMWSPAKKKAKITTACGTMSEDDMKRALKEEYTAYKKAKKSHIENWLSLIESFPPKHRDRILRTEEARRKGAVAHSLTGKLRCATEEEAFTTHLQVNSAKYHQCDNSCFLKEPLLPEYVTWAIRLTQRLSWQAPMSPHQIPTIMGPSFLAT
jgi:hypothetical protein